MGIRANPGAGELDGSPSMGAASGFDGAFPENYLTALPETTCERAWIGAVAAREFPIFELCPHQKALGAGQEGSADVGCREREKEAQLAAHSATGVAPSTRESLPAPR